MTDRRTFLSRPRTRVYDCNYTTGENLYKPMVEQLDRKYYGKTKLPSPPPFVSQPSDNHSATPPRRTFTNDLSDFDSLSDRRSRLTEARSMEEDLEDNIYNSMKKLKALRAARSTSIDEELSSMMAKQRKNFNDKLLDSVGVNSKLQDDLEEEIMKKRMVKLPSIFDEGEGITIRSAMKNSFADESSESRARKSRARIADIENEMDALVERSAARDRRLANVKALIAGEDPFPDVSNGFQSSKKISSSSVSSRSVKKVNF